MKYKNQHIRADHRLDDKMEADREKAFITVRDLADGLVIGQTYTIKAQNYGMEFTERTWGGGGKAEKPVKMELIDLYPNFARFRRKAGYTESFSYWDLARRLLHG